MAQGLLKEGGTTMTWNESSKGQTTCEDALLFETHSCTDDDDPPKSSRVLR